MKKTLIALAALAATGAFAQSSVTLGGNLDQTMANQGSVAAWGSNHNSTSLFSLTGTEDLGGGMKANFNLISEINLMKGQSGSGSTGAAATTGQTVDMFNRGANVGVSSNYGTVIVGRQTDPWFEAQGSLNTSGSNSYGFGNLTANQSNGASAGVGTAPNTVLTGFAANTANDGNTGTAPFVFASGVSYVSPTFSGVTFKVMSATATYTNGGVNTGLAYSLNYANGPLKLAYGFSGRNDQNGVSNAWTQTVYGGSYKMGDFTFIVGQNKAKFESAALAGSTATGLGLNYVVNAKVDVNVAWGTLVNDVNSANKVTQLGVTGRYALSKRTSVYAGLGNVNNEGTAAVSAIYAGTGAVAASTTSSYMLGLRHSF